MASKVQSQYSSSDSPFQAKTGTPALAIAAAAWSWVEKILQLAQRTEAPKAARLSMSTAVSTVMCNEPVMRTPWQRLGGGVFAADGHQAGHFVLGDVDGFAAVFGQADVLDFEVAGRPPFLAERGFGRFGSAGR